MQGVSAQELTVLFEPESWGRVHPAAWLRKTLPQSDSAIYDVTGTTNPPEILF